MGFVCEWEVFEIIEKTFLRGDTGPPAAQGELGLLLLVPGWAGPAKPHTTHLHCRGTQDAFVCTHGNSEGHQARLVEIGRLQRRR